MIIIVDISHRLGFSQTQCFWNWACYRHPVWWSRLAGSEGTSWVGTSSLFTRWRKRVLYPKRCVWEKTILKLDVFLSSGQMIETGSFWRDQLHRNSLPLYQMTETGPVSETWCLRNTKAIVNVHNNSHICSNTPSLMFKFHSDTVSRVRFSTIFVKRIHPYNRYTAQIWPYPPPFEVSWSHTIGHSVKLLWTSDQPVAETSTYTGQYNM
jgi:hypothetical protein